VGRVGQSKDPIAALEDMRVGIKTPTAKAEKKKTAQRCTGANVLVETPDAAYAADLFTTASSARGAISIPIGRSASWKELFLAGT
jgi:hypothetical protein